MVKGAGIHQIAWHGVPSHNREVVLPSIDTHLRNN